jgi:pentatricopeptide repeat protein
MVFRNSNAGMDLTAFSYYNDFKRHQHKLGETELPTLQLYRMVIIMFINLRDLKAAEVCFEEIRKSKIIKPNSFIYSNMMYAYLRNRMPHKVQELYQEMVANDVLIVPNCKKLYAMAQGGAEFKVWYDEFISESESLVQSGKATPKNLADLKSTFISLYEYITSYSRDYEFAKRFAGHIENLGLDLKYFIGHRFFIACSSFDHACIQELLKVYRKDNITFSKHSHLAHITYFHKMRLYSELLTAIEKYNQLYPPTTNTIYLNLKCYLLQKEKFLETLEKYKDFPWDGRIYTVIIDFYGKDCFDAALFHWNEFLRKDALTTSTGVKPTRSYIYARNNCTADMLRRCISSSKYDVLKKVWLDSVIALDLDRNEFSEYHSILIPDGDGQTRLIDIK